MLMEAEGRNDRQEDLLLHDISIAEFECEMHKKNPQTKTIIYLIFLMFKSLIKNALK